MIKNIVLDTDEGIREVSLPIDPPYLRSVEFKSLCTDLIDTLQSFKYGVAISAIQIGIPKRIFLVQRSDRDGRRESPKYYINPIVESASEKLVKYYEACLSVNYAQTFGEVVRKYWVRISYLDENGNSHTEKYDGLDARIILHEIDHLEGILFTDIVDMSTVKELKEYLGYIKKR
ncbi:MAG: Peptide deformylase [candidate division WS6 bacterium GW2011_GWC1_36_11]|uniref:Peptide deformylase n=3 Tax=Candidatus Dojkabacteria TaxID=74243 RepID=A0A0G0FYV6_9BACT|nr:MAG: Peptide deformylase [candidate division WS6 bacterium GW2011_GWC1_36_11]KKQ04668.1 MAG: Peptide deformylase [candidate division WS6 bacterium GW2011_WS6_36_26]HAM96296.1 peptide deformylase [Patescibacteria group bacterium]